MSLDTLCCLQHKVWTFKCVKPSVLINYFHFITMSYKKGRQIQRNSSYYWLFPLLLILFEFECVLFSFLFSLLLLLLFSSGIYSPFFFNLNYDILSVFMFILCLLYSAFGANNLFVVKYFELLFLYERCYANTLYCY